MLGTRVFCTQNRVYSAIGGRDEGIQAEGSSGAERWTLVATLKMEHAYKDRKCTGFAMFTFATIIYYLLHWMQSVVSRLRA
jgi:hypothetical protein